MTRVLTSACALALAACTHGTPAENAAGPEPSGNALADAAALLVAGEEAAGPAERGPVLARLNGLQVAAAEGESDDPLSGWRAQSTAAGPVYRGRALGPAYRRARIAPGERMQIEQIFYAGERAEIAAQSSGGQPVALEIRNPRTGKVCAAELSPKASCAWLPLFTERFSIELVNQSRDQASVYIVFR